MESFDCFKVKTNYKRTDDLKEGSPPNHTEILVQILWQSTDEDPYPNDFVFMPSRYKWWIPERDLKILEKVSSEEYQDERNLGLIETNNRL